MKRYLILFFLLNTYWSFSQKIKSVGLDIGSNISPILSGFQGFSGSILMQVSDSTDKSKTVEYTVGFASFNKTKKDLFQGNKGFFVAIGKVGKKNFGWHGIISIYEVHNILNLYDYDFDIAYQNDFGKEGLLSVGADFFYEVPIKFSEKVQTNLRMSLSASIGAKTGNAEYTFYAPGLNQLTPRIILPNFGFGISMPLFVNLK
jgi:hypothetical protein